MMSARTYFSVVWQQGLRLLKKPTVLFTANRYVGYLLQFVRGLLLANLLGRFSFGVWGFLMLVTQYLSYTSLGLQYAVNVELAVDEPEKRAAHGRLIGVTIRSTWLITAVLLLLSFGWQQSQLPLFEKYQFSNYALLVALIAGLTHINQVYINVYRVYNALARIAAYELLLAALPLLVLLFVQGDSLIMASLWALVVANAVGVCLFAVCPPFAVQPGWDWALLRHLLRIGIPLLVYNLSFWLIILAGRTIVSAFYSVEMMGYFTLAYTLANATLLGLRAVAWLIFPSVLAKTHQGIANADVRRTVHKVNDMYGTAVFLAVFAAILLSPLVGLLLPEYQPGIRVLIVLLLSQAVLSVTFGYNSVAIARKRQMQVAAIAMMAVGVVLLLGLLMAWLKLDILWVATAVLLGSFVFTFWQAQLGERLIQEPGPKVSLSWLRLLPPSTLLAIILILIGCWSQQYFRFNMTGLAVFLLGNRLKLKQLWQTIYTA